MHALSSRYNPKEVEDKHYRFWEENGLFHAERNPAKKPFSIVIPPPNITGILHMGHALNNTIQDILNRWRMMQGRVCLWMPGTDHAGIATQNVVEKKIAKDGHKRQDFGRDRFLKEVWKWRDEYGETIIRQLKKLGASCDWERVRFTMDEGYSEAVLEVFIHLYRKGLVYRENKIINWCPRCRTALSDEEAAHHEIQGYLYYLKYPFRDNPTRFITVATTRPETMLGDTAVAVNPKDKRYKADIGKTLTLPLINREIKIIADTVVDMKFGSGAVKVTPAHDPNDYGIGKRHKLEFINIMHPNGVLNDEAGEYENMDRFEAREVIVESLKERKLLARSPQPHKHAVGHCYRCRTIIEPYLSRQWFVKMKPLAKPAIEAVKKGEIKFYPKRWTKVYLNWMENIQDWCISRQIWWGHRLPVYYCQNCLRPVNESTVHSPPSYAKASPFTKVSEDKSEDRQSTAKKSIDTKGVIVSREKPKKCPHCASTKLEQDPDVLDTWFSSWLWPFAVFGWPFAGQKSTVHSPQSTEKRKKSIDYGLSTMDKKDLDYFYPTSVLVTAPEIIFFWVARMVMAGFEFIGRKPFSDVYIHGTVRDSKGKKMSKSLGNIIDPLDIISEFGCDALRFSIIYLASSGQDVFLAKEKFELGRNFANKIWNASRFALMSLESSDSASGFEFPASGLSLADKWILSRLNRAVDSVTKSLEKFRFNDAAAAIYEFFWHEFCDWYLELIKPALASSSKSKITRAVLFRVLEDSLRLLHPFMPFISEELYQHLKGTFKISKNKSVMLESWPVFDKKQIDKTAEEKMGFVIAVISAIRNIRSEMNIPQSKKVDVLLASPLAAKRKILTKSLSDITRLSRAGTIKIEEKIKPPPKSSATALIDDTELFVLLEGTVDLKAEKERLRKKIIEINEELSRIDRKLKNKDFLTKAPPEIVSQEKHRQQTLKTSLTKLEKRGQVLN